MKHPKKRVEIHDGEGGFTAATVTDHGHSFSCKYGKRDPVFGETEHDAIFWAGWWAGRAELARDATTLARKCVAEFLNLDAWLAEPGHHMEWSPNEDERGIVNEPEQTTRPEWGGEAKVTPDQGDVRIDLPSPWNTLPVWAKPEQARSLASALLRAADEVDPSGAKPKSAVVNIQVRQSFKEPRRIASAIREALRGTFEAGTIHNVVVEPERVRHASPSVTTTPTAVRVTLGSETHDYTPDTAAGFARLLNDAVARVKAGTGESSTSSFYIGRASEADRKAIAYGFGPRGQASAAAALVGAAQSRELITGEDLAKATLAASQVGLIPETAVGQRTRAYLQACNADPSLSALSPSEWGWKPLGSITRVNDPGYESALALGVVRNREEWAKLRETSKALAKACGTDIDTACASMVRAAVADQERNREMTEEALALLETGEFAPDVRPPGVGEEG